jgi:hypothetical protein
MKKLPLGISDFPRIIEDDYVYVDKTEYVYDLLNKGPFYFFSRPRRFGKSLLISTLKEALQGNRHLFEDLWISKSDYKWQAHPIIHLDFSIIGSDSALILKTSLAKQLNEIATEHNITLEKSEIIEDVLRPLIQQLSLQKGKIGLLIDEYDYPLLKHIHNLPAARDILAILRSFFSVVKGMSSKFHIIFITGITKFSKASIFSGLNNLFDITMDSHYSALLGYTENEINLYFPEYIAGIAKRQGTTPKNIMKSVQAWYNGYQFSAEGPKVYNPFSMLYFLKNGELENYWFETGTPTFLLNLLKERNYPIQELQDVQLNKMEMISFDMDGIPLIPLLLQTGYLTIKSYDPNTKNYTLDYPNKEVQSSLLTHILKHITETPISSVISYVFNLQQSLKNNTLGVFFSTLQEFFAGVPYDLHISLERYYQTIFYVIMKLIGAKISTEVKTNIGRMDAVIETKSHIYILEFKLDGTGQEALSQIEEKKYYEKYLGSTKQVLLIGISFNSKTKNISNDWVEKPISKQ